MSLRSARVRSALSELDDHENKSTGVDGMFVLFECLGLFASLAM